MAISYNKIDVGDNNYKISPSSLTMFYRNPKEWLNSFEGNASFKGNTSTILGTCIHYIFESHFDKRTDDRYWEDVKEYISDEVTNEVITSSQSNEVMATLTTMFPEIKDWIENKDAVEVINSEPEVKYKLPKSITGNVEYDYYVAGSIDAIVLDETAQSVHQLGIRDYKSSKRKVNNINNYIHQLVTYATAWNATHGEDEQVGFVEVVNIYNTATKGVQFNVIRRYLTKELTDGLNDIFKEIVLSHKTITTYPKLRNLMFREGVDFMGKLKDLGEKDE